MKCPKCGAENPDYAFFCGRCAADMKEPGQSSRPGEDRRTGPLPSLYSMLSSRLVVVEKNIRKRAGVLRAIRESLYRGGNIVFKSESEVVTLVLDKDHHASLMKGLPTKIDFEFSGALAAYLEMFPERGGFGGLPDSISLGSRIKLPSERSELMVREIAENMLEGLFTPETSVE